MSKRRAAGYALLCAAVLGLAAWWRPWYRNPDLTRAIDAGVGRRITAAPEPRSWGWSELAALQPGNDSLLKEPLSLCWSGQELVVADGRKQRVRVFDDAGRYLRGIGGRGIKEGQYLQMWSVHCAAGPSRLLVADAGSRRISFYDDEWRLRASAKAPAAPGFDLYLGDFELLPDGRWFDSWLGMGRAIGPYLEDSSWEQVRLVRAWNPSGERHYGFGTPDAYEHTVARRVFNRTYLAAHRDTLWVLTQGNATVRGFDVEGRPAGSIVRLPVYYRGAEPKITVKKPPVPGVSFRPNKLIYQPNTQGLAVVQDTLFATLRFRNWRIGVKGASGNRSIDYWSDSAVEVVDRRGRVLLSLAVPGKAVEIASDHGNRVAVLSEFSDGTRQVLATRLPPLAAGGAR
jgi:hypothetical protein